MRPPAKVWGTFFAAALLPAFAIILQRLVQPLLRRRSLRVPPPAVTPYGCPLPPVIHRRVEQVKPGRLIVVGDVHGCPELFRLLESLRYDPSADNLLLAGDLVNKGPASLAVLDALPALQAAAVRGNHDDAVLGAWLRARHRDGGGGGGGRAGGGGGGGGGGNEGGGGAETLQMKFAWAAGMSEAQAALLAALPYTVSVPQYGIAVVHAGLVPGVSLEDQELWAMYKMRNVVRDGEREGGAACGAGGERAEPAARQGSGEAAAAGATHVGTGAEASRGPARYRPVEKAKDGGEPWAALWCGPPHVFFGHDARRGLQLHPAATGLDTGAVYGGSLTAAVMPPLQELRARSGSFVEALAAGRAVSREDLMVELVSMPAAEVYSPTSAPAPAPALAVAGADGGGGGGREGRAAAAGA